MKATKYLRGYLGRPYLWKDLLRQPYRLAMLRMGRERTGAAARLWAEHQAKDVAGALSALGCDQPSFQSEQRSLIAAAEQAVQRCPIRLGGAGNTELLYGLVRAYRPTHVVETGVAYGWSSLAILTALSANGSGHLMSVDRPDMSLKDDRFIGCAVPVDLRARWTLQLGVDKDRLPGILDKVGRSLSMAHYDSDKSYLGRAWAYPKIWEHLRSGGVLVSDDISDNLAFRDFSDMVGVPPVVVRHGRSYAGVLLKPA